MTDSKIPPIGSPRKLYEMFAQECAMENAHTSDWIELPTKRQNAWGRLWQRLQREHGLKTA